MGSRTPETVVAIFGPTAVGKTAVAVALAARLRARGEDPVAISADALQVYRGLETLTGVASQAEREQLEHRLVAEIPLEETYSVGAFMPRAHAEVDRALADGRRPIVIGGTGLYLRAALADLSLRPPAAPDARAELTEELERAGPESLHARLVDLDPDLAAAIAPADGKRLIRVLELIDAGESPHRSGGELWTRDTRHPTLLAALVMDRDALYRRIDARCAQMVADGAEREVRAAVAAGVSETARQAVGFEELVEGDLAAMQRRARRYAKRQLTWMRKLPDAHLIDVTGRAPDAIAESIATALAIAESPSAQPVG